MIEEWGEAGKWTSAVQTFFIMASFFAAVVFEANFLPSPKAERSIQWITEDFASPPPEPAPVETSDIKHEPRTETPAEIALRREEEKRKEDEEKAHKKREEEKRRRAEEKEREEKERKRREEEKKREEERKLAEAQAEEERKKREADEARRDALGQLTDNYKNRIIVRIEQHLIEPIEAHGIANLEVVVEVRLNEKGHLADNLPPLILEPSGVPEYDESVKRAIFKALPLPMPKEPELVKEFRLLRLHITPE